MTGALLSAYLCMIQENGVYVPNTLPAMLLCTQIHTRLMLSDRNSWFLSLRAQFPFYIIFTLFHIILFIIRSIMRIRAFSNFIAIVAAQLSVRQRGHRIVSSESERTRRPRVQTKRHFAI